MDLKYLKELVGDYILASSSAVDVRVVLGIEIPSNVLKGHRKAVLLS